MKKTCSKCNKEKQLSEFHKEKKGKLGVRAECKECAKKRHSTYDTKEKYRSWVKRNAEKGTVVYWNKRASRVNARYLKRYGVVEKITGQELYDKFSNVESCCYCGTEITHNTCHVEHVNPLSNGGSNTIENVNFSCGRCNVTKNNKTDKEFFKYVESVYNHLKNIYGSDVGNTERSLSMIGTCNDYP